VFVFLIPPSLLDALHEADDPMRATIGLLSSIVSGILGLGKIIFIGEWASRANDDRLLDGLDAPFASRLQITRRLVVPAIVFTVIQLAYATLFWHRKNRVYLRCAGLIGLDVVVVGLFGALFHSSVPFLYKNLGDEDKPVTDGHVVRHTWPRTATAVVLGFSVVDLCLHVVAVLLWTALVPAHERLPNVQRPISSDYHAVHRMEKAKLRRQYSASTQGIILPSQESSGPLDRLYLKHEQSWRTERSSSFGTWVLCHPFLPGLPTVREDN
jgi:hypothetical protein